MLAALLGRAQALEALLRAGASVQLADSAGQTALHKAAWMQEGRSAACVEALLKAGADVAAVDAAGERALHKAAYHRGFVPALEALLAAGAGPGAKVQSPGQKAAKAFTCGESAGQTALQLAERRGHAAAVQLLREAQIKAKADEAALKAAFNRPEVQQKLKEKEDEVSSLSKQLKELELLHVELMDRMQQWKGDVSACRGLSADDLEALLGEQEQHVAALRQRVLERHREEAAQAAAAEAKEAALCMICLERHRDVFLNCGHLVCSKCAAQLRKCPACRAAVVRTTRAWL